MKRSNNIYKQIYDLDNIIKYEHIVSINTKNKRKVERYEEYVSENIYRIREDLISKSYVPGKYNIFLIHEPKLRLIMSQELHDKVINHLVSKYLLTDIFDNTFIDTNVATRKNKGTHYGIKTLTKYLNKMKNDDIYYLKFDIKKYFYNIDHQIVKILIERKIKDKDALNIIYKIIDSTDEEYVNENIIKLKENEINRIKKINISNKNKKINEVDNIPLYKKGKGFPIGNMSSQIVATLYLSELDHYIKEKLKIKYYICYMDDAILLYNDKDYLKYCLIEIEKNLKKYKLEFNTKKRV